MPSGESEKGGLWGIVLAAGEGNRIRQFIEERYGLRSPKQYVAFTGKRSMLQQTLRRAERLIPPEQILTVVDPRHMREIAAQLSDRPRGTVIFQPRNRETAPGVLLPLIHILKRDPEARVAIFPSDHFILEEARFMDHVASGDEIARRFPDQVVLLGVRPDGPEVEYGWIEPAAPIASRSGGGARRVGRFLEKPDPESALRFYEAGYLWNTFVIVAKGETLVRKIRGALPGLWRHFERIRAAIGADREFSVAEEEYRRMAAANLSREVFQKDPSDISVIEVREVFWSDWGSGPRVLETLKAIGKLPLREELLPRNRLRAEAQEDRVAI